MKRLFEDPQMSSQLREDLLRSRHAGEEYDTAAQLMPLRAALSDTSRDPLYGESLEAAGAAEPASFWHSVPASWKIVAIIAAVGGVAAFVARPSPRAASPERAPAVVVSSAPAATPPVVKTVEAPAAKIDAVEPTTPAVATPAAVSSSSSRREISQVVRIRALLETNPRAAYRLAQRSEQEFPRGVLSEERQALSVIALSKSGAADAAQRKARAFFSRYPQSPMRELVEAALGR
jgi:hypothetical protein